MASIFAHAAVGIVLVSAVRAPQRVDESSPAAGLPLWRRPIPRAWLIAMVCAVLPDIDVLGFSLGIQYVDPLGHRGFTHSLLFAALMATAGALAFPRDRWRASRMALLLAFFLAGASHGVLDAMTNEGLGVAFFSPFDLDRYFLPWRPIQVSPIGVAAFFSREGLAVIASETRWILIPAAVAAAAIVMVKRGVRRGLAARA